MRCVRSYALAILLIGSLAGPDSAAAGGLSFVEFEQGLIQGTTGLVGAIGVAVSPDSEHVYTVGRQEDAVSAWDRDPGTNLVTLVEIEEDGVGGVDGMLAPNAVTVSPDGACVYVVGDNAEPGPGGNGAVVAFTRTPATGALTFVEFEQDDTAGVDGLDGAIGVVVSPDDDHVYVAGDRDNAVAIFSRTAPACALTFVGMAQDGVSGVVGMGRPESLAISADGLHVYVGARIAVGNGNAGTVAALSRNPITGALSFVEFEQDQVAGVDRLTRVVGIAVSPDGNTVYAASREGDAVVAFSRNGITGGLTFLETERRTGLAKGFKGATGVTVSPGNDYVYVSGRGDDAVAVFARDTGTGELSFLELHDDPVPGTNVLGSATGVAASADGTGAYVVAFGPNTLAAFTVDVCGDGNTGIDEQCDDGNLVSSDGCSSTCRLELCGPLPTGTCHAATALGGASLQIKDQAEDRKDQLKWNWRGQGTSIAQFGNPVTTASYVICVYDSSINPQPLVSHAAPFDGICAEKPCWVGKPTSFQYSDKLLTPDGLKKIQLKANTVDDKPKVQVQGAGIFVLPTTLPLTLPVTVQVKNTENTECWEAVYSTADKNDPAQFKAKSD